MGQQLASTLIDESCLDWYTMMYDYNRRMIRRTHVQPWLVPSIGGFDTVRSIITFMSAWDINVIPNSEVATKFGVQIMAYNLDQAARRDGLW